MGPGPDKLGSITENLSIPLRETHQYSNILKQSRRVHFLYTTNIQHPIDQNNKAMAVIRGLR